MNNEKQNLVIATYAKYGVFKLDTNLLNMFDSALRFEDVEDVKDALRNYNYSGRNSTPPKPIQLERELRQIKQSRRQTNSYHSSPQYSHSNPNDWRERYHDKIMAKRDAKMPDWKSRLKECETPKEKMDFLEYLDKKCEVNIGNASVIGFINPSAKRQGMVRVDIYNSRKEQN